MKNKNQSTKPPHPASLAELISMAVAAGDVSGVPMQPEELPALVIAAALLEVRNELIRVHGALADLDATLFK